ncbi:squalene--hopene cyclase [Cohnella endophytica]|uniref:Squalene--hopene cyclase n=1 Tax=Cohnella endophytica TaxID=2419778 RepID=A0A494Y3I2_9BACL|nr:squalene--hopene cyclase [Cohnella endophytica]RKP55051.1 squalene--hopene cyclase [Cohnella endophytica]
MGNFQSLIEEEIHSQLSALIRQQKQDGSWRFCFENGTTLDAYVIILLRTLDVRNEVLIRQLHDRILAEQQPDGCWKWYRDEEGGNLSASVEAYYALLYSGFTRMTDEPVLRAKSYIQSKGGIGKTTSILTRAILAATGHGKWPMSIASIPLEALLLPVSFPINVFEFSGYSRVHLIPMLIMADRNFSLKTEHVPDRYDLSSDDMDYDNRLSRGVQEMVGHIQAGLSKLTGTPRQLREAAKAKAEQFLLQRIEPDGTLYSYASCTILMIFALLALGYEKNHPLITRAVQGITDMQCRSIGRTTIQNSTSTVWDTALIASAMQEAGVPDHHPAIRKAAAYLLARQHDKKADWSIHNSDTVPGGWGFSDTNTLNPDVDDATAALRAIRRLSRTEPLFRESWNRGLNWVLSMQNKDGGWPAFEKNADNKMLTWLAIDGAKSAAIDPSEADLTGRTLEYLGNFAGLGMGHEFMKRGTDWLKNHQERDGSWYGRWGICYIYGTWAALTGLRAAGIDSDDPTIRKGTDWLLSIQNTDGGWGESCNSDRLFRYVPLGESTPSQTAWAVDALIAVHPRPSAAIDKGIHRLIASLHDTGWAASYPTGAGLPGNFYSHYHSYRYIWPLLALSHYRKKYGEHESPR